MKAPIENELKIKVLPYAECIAKTIETADGAIPGAQVFDHCLTVGLVARNLLSRIAPFLRTSLFPVGVELIAALHDIGKVSPGFQTKIFNACGIDLNLGVPPDLDRIAGFHPAVGAAALYKWGEIIQKIVGQHHGSMPEFIVNAQAEIYGGLPWQAEREKLVAALQNELGALIPKISNQTMADAIGGLVTLSDWLGSGDALSMHTGSDDSDIVAELDEAGFIAPAIRKNLDFKEIFGFDANSIQREIQPLVEKPGVYVVEAPMGLGKTEAALYAGYRLLEKGLATGIYFALPTRATSDRMQERMDRFLVAILEQDSPHRKAHLLHGTAWLRNIAMGEDAAPGGSWFDYSKRGILAPFCVGTIDQALLAVMNVRHGFVRSFGLAGKVVILDEVHSYDCYTGTLLDTLIAALEKLGSTVLILSATLTRSRRDEMIGFRDRENISEEQPYPLISSAFSGSPHRSIAVEIHETGNVSVQIEKQDSVALAIALDRAASGQQVLWIENTVKESQDIFSILAARTSELDIPCGLLHSRFLLSDRERKEAEWVRLYGKEGSSSRWETGRILVGTQVLEQSLDIDADLLVSRLAPMDMLLQRIGRLWRHHNNDERRREIRAERQAWILTPPLVSLEADPNCLGKSSRVYAPYVLCRTLEILEQIKDISIPKGVRRLMESTYERRDERESLQRYQDELNREREKLRRLARGNLGMRGKSISDQGSPTRYAEVETKDLLLLRSVRFGVGRHELVTAGGQHIRFEEPMPSAQVRRHVAAALLKNVVSIPTYLAPTTPRGSVQMLAPYLYLGQDDTSATAVGIVGEDQLVRTIDGELMQRPSRMSYGEDFGYRSIE